MHMHMRIKTAKEQLIAKQCQIQDRLHTNSDKL